MTIHMNTSIILHSVMDKVRKSKKKKQFDGSQKHNTLFISTITYFYTIP